MSTRAASSERARSGAKRVFVGGAPGSGKTALLEQLIPRFIARGHSIAIVASGHADGDDAQRLRYSGLIVPERVTTRANGPRRDRAAIDDAAVRGLERQFGGLEMVLLECSTAELLRPPDPQAPPSLRVMVSDCTGAADLDAAVLAQCDLLVVNHYEQETRSPGVLQHLGRKLARLEGQPPLHANFLTGEGIDAVEVRIARSTLEWSGATRR